MKRATPYNNPIKTIITKHTVWALEWMVDMLLRCLMQVNSLLELEDHISTTAFLVEKASPITPEAPLITHLTFKMCTLGRRLELNPNTSWTNEMMLIDSKLKNSTNNLREKFLSLKHMIRNRLDKSCSKEFRGEGLLNQIGISMIFSRCLQVLEDKGAYKAAVVVGLQVEVMR